MADILLPFLRWYLVVQLLTAAALPLGLRFFGRLPYRGYAFARILGILLASLILWLGASYGLLRNTTGGAWASVALLACLSLWAVYAGGGRAGRDGEGDEGAVRRPARLSLPPRWHILWVEGLFLVAFAAWTLVRAHDPAINHTEQPMDLMFMNGIWSSPTLPPRDPWLAGYAIGYYYFGYWMLTTLARLAGQTPEIAYNLGQACWFGLLVSGSFGLGSALCRLRAMERAAAQACGGAAGGEEGDAECAARPGSGLLPAAAGGLTAATVALTSNLHVLLEWSYAMGLRVDSLIRVVDVHNFPEQAWKSGLWYIDSGWTWWWRASRVIEDLDLAGNHIEIIDEFPIFSYVLGDNHPHVLAMPFALLAIAVALNWYCGGREQEEDGGRGGLYAAARDHVRRVLTRGPLGPAGLLIALASTGALLFLNTWDFPPYALLMLLAALFAGRRGAAPAGAATRFTAGAAATWAAALLAGPAVIYLPYLLSAQSQAGGVLPNLLFPTRLPQLLLMFGHLLLAVVSLLLLAWRELRPSAETVARVAGLALGLPLFFLLVSGYLAAGLAGSGSILPQQVEDLGAVIVQRRLSDPWTFLTMGALTSAALALLWQRFNAPGSSSRTTTFVLCLAAIGCLLAYAPEFIYLRDNFGNRMNTVFKFYYQGWLLLAVAAAFSISAHMGWTSWGGAKEKGGGAPGAGAAWRLLPGLSLLLILACLVYPVAGVYAKVRGFGTTDPTLNGLSYIGEEERQAIDWIRRNTPPDAVILEAKGVSYRVSSARISAATGRATLLGWDGHEAQWRGAAYAGMAAGRADAIREIYQRPNGSTWPQLLREWKIDYLLVGPEERAQYGITPELEARLSRHLEAALEVGSFRVYRVSEVSK